MNDNIYWERTDDGGWRLYDELGDYRGSFYRRGRDSEWIWTQQYGSEPEILRAVIGKLAELEGASR